MRLLPKSIRWRLQLWYGLFLLLVLVGFGATAYQLQRSKQFRQLDDALQRRSAEVANVLRPSGQRGRSLDRPPFRDGPPELRAPPLERRPVFPPEDPQGELPEPRPRIPGPIRLPAQQAGLFDESDTNGFYYVVWGRDGSELARSSNAPPGVPRPSPSMAPIGPRGPQPPRTRGTWRESFILMPPGEVVLAGCSVAPDQAELRRTAWRLTATGGIILLLGLAGGGWIAARAIRPIRDISATAVKIASGDLSQRINLAETESELGRLAGVLNSTFTRLEAAFGQQKQFASDAAHELRTPVSVVLTQTQTALNRDRSAPEYRETIEACQRAAQRMRGLIESLLELARLDAGQEPMKRVRFDLAASARDCVELIRPLAAQHGISLDCDLPSLECQGDPDRLAQVITNLLANAIRYNRPGGAVRVTGESAPGAVLLCVADTGPGIAPEDLPRIFDRFYRAEQSRSTGGAGLGLAISKAIVAAHGGEILAASEPSQGAVFTLRLPLDLAM